MDQPAEEEQLLAELGRLLDRASPLPSQAVEAAKESYTWRTIDMELAELTSDSLVDRVETATRGAAGPRALTFETGGLVIELEVEALRSGRRILGQLVPPRAARIEVCQGDATRTVEADQAGRFTVKGLPGQPVSLRCHLPGRGPVATEWVRI